MENVVEQSGVPWKKRDCRLRGEAPSNAKNLCELRGLCLPRLLSQFR
jgi:hypothetical protein